TPRLTVAGCLVSEAEVRADFPAAVGRRVSVIPFVSREDMPKLYASHGIFVFPSLVEGMPLTLLEAMASGMPVVTTNTCGMAGVVEDGKTGLVVPAADSSALCQALLRVRESPELRSALGLCAQQAAKGYLWNSVVKQLEHILRLAVASETKRTKPFAPLT